MELDNDPMPKAALAIALKVDMEVLPADLVDKINRGQVNLDDPAITYDLVEYLKLL